MKPGELFFAPGDIECNAGKKAEKIKVSNTGDRPVQVGSHFHFFEANKALQFDRAKAFGHRLDIPAGTAVRFEPGEAKEVSVIPFGGLRVAVGFNDLVNGDTSLDANKEKAMHKVNHLKFKNK